MSRLMKEKGERSISTDSYNVGYSCTDPLNSVILQVTADTRRSFRGEKRKKKIEKKKKQKTTESCTDSTPTE